ncbi:MAG: hypothetical protein QXZ17_13570 [Nitrososphaerota archaeon]
MKFSEIIEPQGGYLNDSNSYFLVLGIWNQYIPEPTGPGATTVTMGNLIDQNGNIVDFFKNFTIYVNQWTLSMPVWNGSSVVNENYTLNTAVPIIYQKTIMLIPPGYKFNGFGIAVGFWLEPEEVEKMIIGQGPFNLEKIKGRGVIKI